MYFFIIDSSINSTRECLNLFVLADQASRLFLSVLGLHDLKYSNFIQRLRLKNDILKKFGYLFEFFLLPFDIVLFKPNFLVMQPLFQTSLDGCYD